VTLRTKAILVVAGLLIAGFAAGRLWNPDRGVVTECVYTSGTAVCVSATPAQFQQERSWNLP